LLPSGGFVSDRTLRGVLGSLSSSSFSRPCPSVQSSSSQHRHPPTPAHGMLRHSAVPLPHHNHQQRIGHPAHPPRRPLGYRTHTPISRSAAKDAAAAAGAARTQGEQSGDTCCLTLAGVWGGWGTAVCALQLHDQTTTPCTASGTVIGPPCNSPSLFVVCGCLSVVVVHAQAHPLQQSAAAAAAAALRPLVCVCSMTPTYAPAGQLCGHCCRWVATRAKVVWGREGRACVSGVPRHACMGEAAWKELQGRGKGCLPPFIYPHPYPYTPSLSLT
jgi:hypothetical protein